MEGKDYLFKRDHHIHIFHILQSLNADLLKSHHCYFAGGTAIVLSHGEFRESLDIDFLISDLKGYQKLRQLIKGHGIQSLFRANNTVNSNQKVRADQYGIRTMLRSEKVEIKFEIVLEGRIQLESPKNENKICGVTTITHLDMAASKLLANSDRWHDDSVFSRDLIDLAMLDLSRASLHKAIKKTSEAYGESIEKDLNKAIESIYRRKNRIDDCMNALKILEVPKAVLWKKIRKLQIKE